MRHFRQRVGLVHELAELRRPEELTDGGGGRLGVDQVVRHDGVDIDGAHALADGALHTEQADAVLVLHQLADRPDAAVAEVVDVVDLAAAVLQVAQRLDRLQQVVLAQHALGVRRIGDVQPHVHLHPADGGQVVAVAVEEQATEQGFRRLRGRRLARAHDAVNVDQRVVAVGVLVHRQGVANPRAVRLIDRQRRQAGDSGLLQRGETRLGQFLTGFGVDLTGFRVDQVFRHVAAKQIGAPDQDFLGVFGDLAGLASGQLGLGLGHDLTGGGVDQRFQQFHTAERVGIERPSPALRRVVEHHLGVEVVQDFFLVLPANLRRIKRLAFGLTRRAQLFGRVALQRIQQRCHRQLPLAVDADVDQILAVELEIEPRAAIRDDTGGEQVFAGRVGLAFVVIEEHAGRPVHLRHDHPFGAIDDERAVVGHQRHVAHVDGLLLDVADRPGAGVLIHVPYDQAQDHLQRRRERHAALNAFLNVVFRFFQLIIDEFQPAAAGEIVDREHRFEHFLQPGLGAIVGTHDHLQERLVAGALHIDQVRHRSHFRDPAEAFADALTPSKGPCDRVHR